MKPSSAPKKSRNSKARNAVLMNLLATPGLGSLMAGRWAAGAGQLAIFLAGFVLFCYWSFATMENYYQQAFSSSPPPATNYGRFAIVGTALCMIGWLWALATSISLMREVSKLDAAAIQSFVDSQVKMTDAQKQSALAALPQWQRNGEVISRTYEFTDFLEAMKFVNTVATIAEQVQHHPDVDIRWNKVTLALTTHDAGGLTQKDFAMARQCDGLA